MAAFLLRLDDPTDCSTRLAEHLNIAGWIGLPRTLATDETLKHLTVEAIAEDAGAEVSVANQARAEQGEVLGKAPVRGISISGLVLDHTISEIYGYKYKDFVAVKINGELDVRELLDHAVRATELTLYLIVRSGSHVVFSNRVRVSLLPRSEWHKPFGGFLFPSSKFLNADTLMVEGWALQQDDSVASVEIVFGGKFSVSAHVGFESGHFGKALPDITDSEHCVFRALVKRRDVFASGIDDRVLRTGVSIEARIVFASGKTFSFSLPSFVWGQEEQCGAIRGEIERVHCNEYGIFVVEGWALTKTGEQPSIYLESWRKRVAAARDNDRCRLSWVERPDIEQRFSPQVLGSHYGFQIEIDTQILLDLGRHPGELRLVLESNGERLILGPHGLTDKLNQIVGDRAKLDPNYSNAVAVTAKLLSRSGIRKSWTSVGAGVEKSGGTKKIVFATHNLSEMEGAPRVLQQIIAEVKRNLPEAEILTVSAHDGGLRCEIERQNVQVEIVPELSLIGQNWERYGLGAQKVMNRLRRFGPSLVYANVIDSFWAVDVATRLGCPSCWLIHESEAPLGVNGNLDARLRLRLVSLLRKSRMIFVARATADIFRAYSANDPVVIPNGIDCGKFGPAKNNSDVKTTRARLAISNNETVVSIIGTTTERKGQDIFLREMGLLCDAMPNERFKFFIVGAREIPFLLTLRELTKKIGLEDKVIFVPENPNIRDYFVASDILVICSRKESAPLVSLEAFASGTPLVSTNVFGLAEQVEHEKNALVFDHTKSGALSAAVMRLIQDPLLGHRLAEQARRNAEEKFSFNVSIQKHWNEINQALCGNCP